MTNRVNQDDNCDCNKEIKRLPRGGKPGVFSGHEERLFKVKLTPPKKLETLRRHVGRQESYRNLKKTHPEVSDTNIAKMIADTDANQSGKEWKTILKNMKGDFREELRKKAEQAAC